MNLFSELLEKKKSISIIGLGYVGLPIAVAFAKNVKVIGYDISHKKIEDLRNGLDATHEVGNEVVKKSKIHFTSNELDLKEAVFHIVAVPTPVKSDQTPDLSPLISATKIIGRNMTKGSIVVFESTVYPGVTEEICLPILEKFSGFKLNVDFKIGYSPERINPGDKVHRLESITKVISGSDLEAIDIISEVYKWVVDAGIFKAKSIKVAEAAKVIENAQRDINIAFMNELSMIFEKLNISTSDVLEAAATKWNFLNFKPGLVGGHCIGVDPYYLTYKAKEVGYHPEVILSGRKINDGMPEYIVNQLYQEIIKNRLNLNDLSVGFLGLTFKEDCPDIRNSKAIEIFNMLKENKIEIYANDPLADNLELREFHQIENIKIEDFKKNDIVIVAVPHTKYIKNIDNIIEKITNRNTIIFDIKNIVPKKYDKSYFVWRL